MTSIKPHPLKGDPRWTFFQPTLTVHTRYGLHPVGSPDTEIKSLTTAAACREALIHHIRQAWRTFANTQVPAGPKPWEHKIEPIADIVLDDPRCLEPGATRLSILDVQERPEIKDEVFVQLADAIVGIPCLLLNPQRRPGSWWKTSLLERQPRLKGATIGWVGSDNFFLVHPAIFAIVTGLFRQAYLLCAGGFGERALEEIPRKEVENALDSAEWMPAFEVAAKIRNWISVPAPTTVLHYPFPWYPRKEREVSYWQRFVRLQRAVRRHGYTEVLGSDLRGGWELGSREVKCSGAYSLWGERTTLTPAHKRLMELGKPLKR